jgi:hypothetical protein
MFVSLVFVVVAVREDEEGRELETGFRIRDNSVRRCPEIEFGPPGVTERIKGRGRKNVIRSSKGRVRGGSSGENPIISESGQAFAGGMNGRVRAYGEGLRRKK